MSRDDVLRRFLNFQEARDARRARLPVEARNALGKVRLEARAERSADTTNGTNLSNLADDTDYTLWISDEIGGWWGVTAQDFACSMRQIPKDASLTVMLDSPGGSIFEATPMYNLLKQHAGNTVVNIYGMAASAASFIAMAGKKIKMARNGRMMIHDGQGEVYAYGDEALMREHVNDVTDIADLLSSLSNTIADMYMQKAGGTVADWRARMRATTWYDSSEALSAGLIDEIEGGAPGTAPENALDLELFKLVGTYTMPTTDPAPLDPIPTNALDDMSGLRDALKGVFQ
jgi:ATP-dependent protease ClpP protease subunit